MPQQPRYYTKSLRKRPYCAGRVAHCNQEGSWHVCQVRTKRSRNCHMQEVEVVLSMSKPLILAIGAAIGLVSIALASRTALQRVPNVDGREYVINRWTGRVSIYTSSAEDRK
jgi:hypothetical protein